MQLAKINPSSSWTWAATWITWRQRILRLSWMPLCRWFRWVASHCVYVHADLLCTHIVLVLSHISVAVEYSTCLSKWVWLNAAIRCVAKDLGSYLGQDQLTFHDVLSPVKQIPRWYYKLQHNSCCIWFWQYFIIILSLNACQLSCWNCCLVKWIWMSKWRNEELNKQNT